MTAYPETRPLARWIVVLGVILSAFLSIVPFYSAGYKLAFGTLLWTIVPYVVYGSFSELLRGWALAVPGVAILALDVLVRLVPRIIEGSVQTDPLTTWAPAWLTLVVFPLGALAGHWLARTLESRTGHAAGGSSPNAAPHAAR